MRSTIFIEKKWDLIIALSGVLLGGLIAIIPIIISIRASDSDKLNERKLAIINKRIDLIDKSSQIFYKTPGVEELMNYGLATNSKSMGIDSKGNYLRIPKDIAISKEMSNARADFFSILIQDNLYFGPKTKIAIDKLFKDKNQKEIYWWRIEEEAYQVVIQEMIKELNYKID